MTDQPVEQKAAPDPPKKRRGRWKSVLLIASLALNLFIVAFVFGQATRGYFDEGRRPFDRGNPRVDWTEMVDRLPPDARDEARTVLRESGEEMRILARSLQQAREAATRAALADPYDEEVARAAFAEVRQRTDDIQRLIQEGLLRIAGNLDPDERRRMFERLPPPARP
jgi:uncharacterized membrane protein